MAYIYCEELAGLPRDEVIRRIKILLDDLQVYYPEVYKEVQLAILEKLPK